MKSFILSAIFIFMADAVFCQTKTVEYFTAEWTKTADKSKAVYYREIAYSGNGKPTGIVRDYFMNGTLQWQGVITDFDKSGKEIFNGWCTWYYSNGYPQEIGYFNRNGLLDSTKYYYRENGTILKTEDYFNGVLDGWWISYYPNEKTQYIAFYIDGKMKNNQFLAYDQAGNASMVLNDMFDDNHNNWIQETTNNYSVLITQGKMMFKTTASVKLGSHIYLPLKSDADFSLETTVSFEKGSTKTFQGLVWGFQDWENYEYFIISADGYFQAGRFIKGVDMPFIKMTSTRNLNRGKASNHIKVLKEGDTYFFVANTQMLGNSKFYKLIGEDAGVVSNGGEKTIYFDNFSTTQDINLYEDETPAPKAADPNGGWLGNGSGVLIDVSGIIATNHHVIKDATVIEADFVRNGKQYSFSAEVIKTDPEHDLALLKINDKRYEEFKPKTLPFGIKTTAAQTGASVFALGYPMAGVLGEEIKFTDGKISSGTGIQGDTMRYQISAPIQPGNSGGPLFDNDGNLIGITDSRANMGTQNVSYAIKIAWLVKFAGAYIKLPANTIKTKTTEEKVSVLSPFIPLIKIK
jgi:S1-C subfamily serine protease/antitoxin component YwqK of YwqJK toxin-antitoxin module